MHQDSGFRVGTRARRHGKTKCANTFNGYECVCGPGYVSQTTKDGKLRCLNINECKTLDAADLGRDCTCERCACQDIPGGYRCAGPPSAARVQEAGMWSVMQSVACIAVASSCAAPCQVCAELILGTDAT